MEQISEPANKQTTNTNQTTSQQRQTSKETNSSPVYTAPLRPRSFLNTLKHYGDCSFFEALHGVCSLLKLKRKPILHITSVTFRRLVALCGGPSPKFSLLSRAPCLETRLNHTDGEAMVLNRGLVQQKAIFVYVSRHNSGPQSEADASARLRPPRP